MYDKLTPEQKKLKKSSIRKIQGRKGYPTPKQIRHENIAIKKELNKLDKGKQPKSIERRLDTFKLMKEALKKMARKVKVGPVFLLEDQIPSNLKVETFNKGSSAKKKTKKKRPRGVGKALKGYGKAMK